MPFHKRDTFYISGLEVHVYGLSKVLETKPPVTDLVFLLHGRLSFHESMASYAHAILEQHADSASPAVKSRGLLVVTFDQRNHGHRKVSDKANLSWMDGNPLHA